MREFEEALEGCALLKICRNGQKKCKLIYTPLSFLSSCPFLSFFSITLDGIQNQHV